MFHVKKNIGPTTQVWIFYEVFLTGTVCAYAFVCAQPTQVTRSIFIEHNEAKIEGW